MRVAGLFLLLVALCFAGDRRDARKPGASGPTNGVHTPGIQIPFDSLQPELIYELPATPAWLAFTDAIWVGDKDGLLRIDPRSKESKLGGAAAKLKQPCAGMASGFNSLWAPNCADGSVVRLDARTRKVATTIPSGTGEAKQGIDASRIEVRTGSEGAKTADFWIVPAGATFSESGTTAVDESKVMAVPDHPAARKAKPKAQ